MLVVLMWHSRSSYIWLGPRLSLNIYEFMNDHEFIFNPLLWIFSNKLGVRIFQEGPKSMGLYCYTGPTTQASVFFDGLPKTCPIASPSLGKVVAHRVFAFWVGNCQNLEFAPFDTCCPTSRQSIGNWVVHRSPLRLWKLDTMLKGHLVGTCTKN